MGGKSAKAPDYEAAAEKTAQSSKEVTRDQTYANRADQYTPFGQQTWTQQQVRDPSTGKMVTKWVQTTKLDADAQHALDSQQQLTSGRSDFANRIMPRVQQALAKGPDYSKLHKKGLDVQGREIGGSGSYMSKAGDAIMSQFDARMNPAFQQATADLETQMRNRGLKPGDEAYDRGLAQIRQQQGDQRNQAMYEAQKMQGAEASRMQGMDSNAAELGFQQDMGASQYANQQRQGDTAELQSQRGWDLNEVNALISGQQVGMPSMPQYNTAGASAATNYSGAAQQQYSAAQDKANAANAQFGQILGAASAPFSFGG